MNLGTDPAGRATEVAALEEQIATLRDDITRDTDELRRLQELANAECLGIDGPSTTGRFGEGEFCERRRIEADAYGRAHPVVERQEQLLAMQRQLIDLRGDGRLSSDEFVAGRTAAVDERLSDLPQVDAPIGLLERIDALSKVAATSTTLWLGIWLVRILFITVDCAPVLTKVAAGTTHYDQLVGASLEDAVKTHRLGLEGNAGERARLREVQEEERRAHEIRMAQMRADAVDEREATYERQAAAGGAVG